MSMARFRYAHYGNLVEATTKVESLSIDIPGIELQKYGQSQNWSVSEANSTIMFRREGKHRVSSERLQDKSNPMMSGGL